MPYIHVPGMYMYFQYSKLQTWNINIKFILKAAWSLENISNSKSIICVYEFVCRLISQNYAFVFKHQTNYNKYQVCNIMCRIPKQNVSTDLTY